ncbi:D-aminoacyl-tRNA deacylase, partial [Candidatus Bathyarchaeota archaeon]|nr:D-aminoacyl-tRNA deacylase [Candidatus Bathyarchaeota archaeon]
LNIAEKILNHYNFERLKEKFDGNPIYELKINNREVKLVTLNEESVYAQNITDFSPNIELVVFISRHSSASGIPTLSVHTPGNLTGEAKLGGEPWKVSVSPANAMRYALKVMEKLKEEKNLSYEVSYECTHHGPSLNVPAMFTELGSSLKQWKDSKAAEAVAIATMEAVLNFKKDNVKVVLGIGGPHYNRKFSKLALNSEVAFGHMIPKYVIPNLKIEMLKQCIRKTMEKVECAVLDWKGIKGIYKNQILTMLEELGLPYEKV